MIQDILVMDYLVKLYYRQEFRPVLQLHFFVTYVPLMDHPATVALKVLNEKAFNHFNYFYRHCVVPVQLFLFT